VFHGGDIFNRSKPPKKTVARAYKIIENLLKDDIGFIVAPGNHERSKLPNTLLQYHPKCHTFSNFEVLDLDDQYKLIGFPYTNDAANSIMPKLEHVSTQLQDKSLIVLCHQLFDGAEFGPRRFTFGLVHGAIDPLKIPLNIDLVVTGHIHRAQSLQKGLIVYPGSTERTSFVEVIEPKGYLLLDIQNDALEVSFNEIESIPMEIFEINLEKESFNLNQLKTKIPKGFVRTLIRFTGRSLSSIELNQLNITFNRSDYPLLMITPKFQTQKLKPLFEKSEAVFSFNPIHKKKII
jgi:DNA repair exonuclease SbcCD nuclease subunit